MVENYLGNSVVEEIGTDPKFIRVYNHTTSEVLNGVVTLVVKKWTTDLGVHAEMAAVATNDTAASNIVGIVNNPDETGIAAHSYGLVQIKGSYGSAAVGTAAAYGVTTSGSVAANDYLEVIDGTAVLIDGGTNGGAVRVKNYCALAEELITTDTWKVYLIGEPCSIAAS